MSDHASPSDPPRIPLLAAGALVVLTLLTAAYVRLTGHGEVRVPDAPAVSVRTLLFEDRSDGSIAVLDAVTRTQVDSVPPASNGFLRGTMRGLARERKRQGIGADIAFELVGHADGRLTLLDPATHRRVDLESFGPINAAAFAKLMTPAGRT